jgi:hypothetical protein
VDRESKTDYAEDIDDAVAKMTNEEGIQSITLGFGTYKPFGPVLMRTLHPVHRQYFSHSLKLSIRL